MPETSNNHGPNIFRSDSLSLQVLEVRWVLVEAFSDYPAGVQLLSSANSSLLEMNLRDDNETILFIERNIV